jgi:hypothetical protein
MPLAIVIRRIWFVGQAEELAAFARLLREQGLSADYSVPPSNEGLEFDRLVDLRITVAGNCPVSVLWERVGVALATFRQRFPDRWHPRIEPLLPESLAVRLRTPARNELLESARRAYRRVFGRG